MAGANAAAFAGLMMVPGVRELSAPAMMTYAAAVAGGLETGSQLMQSGGRHVDYGKVVSNSAISGATAGVFKFASSPLKYTARTVSNTQAVKPQVKMDLQHLDKNSGIIKTPHGDAQATTKNALQVRNYVNNGGQLYRTGAFGKSKVTDAQFWSPESPFGAGYANKYGLANSKIDYIIGGVKISGAPYITRPAPPVPPNIGGGIEVVTNPNSVILNFFHMP